MANSSSEKTVNKYQEECSKNPFPGSDVRPEVKATKDFGNKVGSAIYSNHMYYVMSTNRVAKIYENRQYATNNQDPDQYKSIIDPSYNVEQKHKTLYKGSLVNINWGIWSPLKKMVNTVCGMFIDARNSIQYNSIDKTSKAEKERKKNQLLANVYNKKEIQMLSDAVGADIQNLNAEEKEISSSEDVDVYTETSYKTIKEMGMEMLVDHNLKNNRFYDLVEPRIVHDLVENNRALGFTTFDRNHRIKIRYSDIAGYVYPQTDHPTNQEHEYDGEVNLWSIAELRDFLYENEGYDPGTELEELLHKVATKAVGSYGNSGRTLDRFQFRPVYQDYEYNDYRVEALWFNYYSIDSDIVRFKEKDGMNYVDYKKEIPKQPRHDYVKSDNEVCYEGLYIPAMQCVYGWKKQDNMCRAYGEKGAVSRLTRRFIYVEPNKRMGSSSSLIDDTKGVANDIQITMLKIRQLVATSKPPGVMIDWHGMNEVFLATGENVEPSELLNLWETKGFSFYVSRTEDGQFVNVPVHEVANNFMPQLQAHLQNLQFYLSQVRETSGVNEAMDGSVASKDTLVGLQRIKAISGTRLLRELFNAYTNIFMKNLGDVMRDMIQTQIRNGWCEEEYRAVIGDGIYEVLKMDPNKPFPLFGTHVHTLPDESQISLIQRQIEIGLQAGTIQPAQVMDVTSMSNVKKIMAVLKYQERKAQRQRAQQMEMAVQAEASKNQSSAYARANAEEKITMDKKNAEIEKMMVAHNNKLAEIVEMKSMEGSNKLNEINVTADRDDAQIKLALELQALYSDGKHGSSVGTNKSRMPKVRPTGVSKKVSQNVQTTETTQN